MMRRTFVTLALLAVLLPTPQANAAVSAADDPVNACDRAAVQAEAEWNLPSRLLSAIGIVESGRRDVPGGPVPWPWTINAAGRGYLFSSKEEALGLVRAMQALGVRLIDVGCFQVDLFYHSYAFSSLEEAFDPETNARAAARILTQNRMSSVSWEMAIALYHSASPLLGSQYLRQVLSVWPQARTRPLDPEVVYASLLSPGARQVQVLNFANPASLPEGLPRVVTPQSATGVLQWSSAPAGSLPVVLLPPPKPALGRKAPANPFPR